MESCLQLGQLNYLVSVVHRFLWSVQGNWFVVTGTAWDVFQNIKKSFTLSKGKHSSSEG